jgi:hypothetical protein
MSTGGTLHCDKCGRLIELGKGYIAINGWIICGICQWEESQRHPQYYDPNRQGIIPTPDFTQTPK